MSHKVLQEIARSTELELLDPGNAGTINLDRTMGVCSVVTAASESRKIGSPQRTGIIITVCLKTVVVQKQRLPWLMLVTC